MRTERYAIGVILSLLAGQSAAATLTYSSEAEFLAAARSTVVEGFEGLPADDVPMVPDGTPITVTTSKLTASSISPVVTFVSSTLGPAVEGNQSLWAVISGATVPPAAYSFALTEPTQAVGFYLIDAAEAGFISISTSAGDSFEVAACCREDGNRLFFGLVNSQTAFSSFVLKNTVPADGFGVDSVYLGVAAIPEPRTFTLLCLGLACVAWRLRRRGSIAKLHPCRVNDW